MKTAEEVAEELAVRFEAHPLRDQRWGVIADEIAQALTAFAEERVKEYQRNVEAGNDAVDAMAYLLRSDEVIKTRAEALEEAAKVADSCGSTDALMNMACRRIAEKIRALKDERENEKRNQA